VEGVDLTFRGELGVIRNTLATHKWKTGMMKEQAQYLDTVCQILQDVHKDAAAKAMQVLRQ
jgi:hypothetical protein